MAGARQSKASHRRDREARESLTHERVTLIAAGVLVAVAIIVAAGVIWGVVLPPRAHVLTVGNESFTASQAVERAVFLISGSSQSTEEPVTAAVNRLRREAILMQAGASQAGEITTDDMAKAIRKGIGVPEDASAEDYAKQYQLFLEGTNLSKATFERMIRADVIAERLGKSFDAQIGTAGLQYHLMGVASRDKNKLQQLKDAVAGGADFASKALELGIVTPQQTPDLGWSLPPADGYLKDTVKADELQAGQLSEIVERGFQFELYRMVEREDKREYTPDQIRILEDAKVTEWVAQQADTLKVIEDVSDGERRWILRQVAKEAQKIAAKRAKDGPASAPIRVAQ